MTRRKPARGNSLTRSHDPAVCGYPMGVASFTQGAQGLRFCTRPRATCQYHRHKNRQ